MTPFSNERTGWPLRRLDEVCAVNPRRDLTGLPDDLVISKVPMAAIEERTGRLDPSEQVKLGEVKGKSLTHFREDDVVVAKISPSFENGKVAIATGLSNNYAVGTTELIVLRPHEGLDHRYLLHFLLSQDVRLPLAGTFSGTVGQQRISLDEFRAIRVPVPSLPVQHATVESIERMLSHLDVASRELHEGVGRVAVLERSLLRAACRGSLIAGLPQADFKPVPLGDVADTALGKMLSSKVRPRADALPYLRGANVGWGDFDLSELKTMSVDDEELVRFAVEPGDLLVVEGAGSSSEVGRAAIWHGQLKPMLYQKALHRVRPSDVVTAQWLQLVLHDLVKSGRHLRFLTGTTIRHLPQERLRRIPVPLPPLAVQDALVAEHRRLLAQAHRMLGALTSSAARSGPMRRSILKAAFEGRLTSAATTLTSRTFEEKIA